MSKKTPTSIIILIVFLVMVGISLFLPVKRCVKYVFERKNKYIQLENKA